MKKNYKIKKNKFRFYQIKPIPSSEEITKFYANEFYTGEYKNFNDSSLEVQIQDKEFSEGKWQNIYENILEIKKKITKNTSILDDGCGWSQALFFLKKKVIEI